MAGTMEPTPDRRNGASNVLTDVAILSDPSLPCRFFGGQEEPVARRSIEMHEYRQALMRMRQGESEREIARSKLMGRATAARFRELAEASG